MRLDIDKNSLHDLLQGKKEHIGNDSMISGLVNIGSGLAFIVTIISAKFDSMVVNAILTVFAIAIILIGLYQIIKKIIKPYDYEELFKDIVNLSISESKYSLVAIMNTFEGDYANKVLLKYFAGGWKTFMFLSFRTAAENDENNVKNRVSASLKIDPSKLNVKFLTEIPNQEKLSKDHNSIRVYHNKYYQVFISDFPDLLKQPEFTVDGTMYKWMTLEEMWDDDQIKLNNADVLREFEKYIFNTQMASLSQKKIQNKIFIRLTRECNLSCKFCLANKCTSKLTTVQLIEIIERLKMNGVKSIGLTGGEPLLRRDFFTILEYCIKLGFNIIVYSNLNVSDDIIDKLKLYPISISTSIHGDEEFHDSVTKNGAYNKTYSNIIKLRSANIPVSIHMVIMRRNTKYAEQVIIEAINNGVDKITFQTLIPRGKGKSFFENGESKEDIQKALKELLPLIDKYSSRIVISLCNLYEKDCYVLETDGIIYKQKWNSNDAVEVDLNYE